MLEHFPHLGLSDTLSVGIRFILWQEGQRVLNVDMIYFSFSFLHKCDVDFINEVTQKIVASYTLKI